MSSKPLTMGVIGHYNKENEKRAPIDPAHIERIDPELRARIRFQKGYGERFGWSDEAIAATCGGVLDTDALYASSDIILLPKPTEDDFHMWRPGQIIWGWPHCVQGGPITQEGIDKKLTFIAWEAMFQWRRGEVQDLHIFHKNNELAGYCGVVHGLSLAGVTGHYGRIPRAAVISFGLCGRGAIHALQGLGFTHIDCFTRRPPELVLGQIPGVRHRQFDQRTGTNRCDIVAPDGSRTAFETELQGYDVIVNCIFQDTDNPLNFLDTAELDGCRHGTLIVDVSCDEKMGFDFARPTSFEDPSFEVGHGITYYAVDHTPSLMWRSATDEISRALLPFIPTVMGGPEAWDQDIVTRKSIEIRDGVIQNSKILSFQNREAAYPHRKQG